MTEDRFANHVKFPSGVRWEPTDYKAIDQTPYLAYLEKEGLYTEEELRVLLDMVESSREKHGS